MKKSTKNSLNEERSGKNKMIYIWLDKKTETEVAVHRKIKDIEMPPDKDEIPEEMSIEDYAEADWVRVLQGFDFIGPKGKGHWIILLTGGLGWLTQFQDILL